MQSLLCIYFDAIILCLPGIDSLGLLIQIQMHLFRKEIYIEHQNIFIAYT